MSYHNAEPDEFFIGNVPDEKVPEKFKELDFLMTIRTEYEAFDIDGKELPNYCAFYANKSEQAAFDTRMNYDLSLIMKGMKR